MIYVNIYIDLTKQKNIDIFFYKLKSVLLCVAAWFFRLSNVTQTQPHNK